ncbi:hypothetical protein [uncultured Brachyspira sp.]|uniref:hypothetical protein n=1 Tax=uncultured Brachyspira sp. TaxID=221953 RepID=UPI0025D36AA1|nr:hypothetical protein [uncultured Brachyspira sp.]
MFKYILLISFIISSFISCSKNNADNVKRIEIILADESTEVKEYDEEKLKKSALSSLEEFYSMPYNQDSVRIAYEKFYSSNYKEILKKSRNIKNADEYVQSDPSLDFEFEAKIEKVYNIKLDGRKAYIDADSLIYDRVEDTTSKSRQTFVMSYENDKWVIL